MSRDLRETNESLREAHASLSSHADVLSELREFSHAIITSLSPDYYYCSVVLGKNGKAISKAILALHPKVWNVIGYPKVGDAVLVYHQRENQDAHVIAVLHPKTKSFYKYEVYLNNGTDLPAGALAG